MTDGGSHGWTGGWITGWPFSATALLPFMGCCVLEPPVPLAALPPLLLLAVLSSSADGLCAAWWLLPLAPPAGFIVNTIEGRLAVGKAASIPVEATGAAAVSERGPLVDDDIALTTSTASR